MAWDDQVVIKNTTTGDTLVTADVLTDPNVLGPLAPGASIARHYAFTLPTGADGTGNIQVTVTANVGSQRLRDGDQPGQREPSDAMPTARTIRPRRRRSRGRSRFRPGPGGHVVPIPWASSRPPAAGPRSTSRSPSPGATTLDTLINSTYGVAGDTVGTVEVKGTGGLVATFNLVEGTNIRDYNNDGYEDTVAAGTSSATFGNGQVRLDMQTFALPAAFATATITDIILTSEGGTPQGNPFLAAATVATKSGPSQIVLLGAGVVPDSHSSATKTVVSGGSAPGQVSVVLDPASDSGTRGTT